MKYGKRIVAFALSAVVAFGAVTYRQPKAHASVGGMIANMCLSTYMTATGISLVPDDATSERICDAISALVPQFLKEYAYEVGEFTVNAFYNVINRDCVIRTDGKIQIAHEAAALLGHFTGWLYANFDMTNNLKMIIGSQREESYPLYDYETYPYWAIKRTTDFYRFYALKYPLVHDNDYISTSSSSSYLSWDFTDSTWVARGLKTGYVSMDEEDFYLSNCNIIIDVDDEELNFEDISPVTFMLTKPFELPPTVEDQYSLVIDPAIPFSEEQDYIDNVLAGALAGTLSPTYTVEQSTTGDVVIPDEGTDEDYQGGILSWLKKIWESIKELPQSIANALSRVFVPSDEYMATVPDTIVETFDNRTGFLTYPVTFLYTFCDSMDTPDRDFVLSWPTVIEPFTGSVLMPAGEFNVSQFVRDNQAIYSVYFLYLMFAQGFLIMMFFGLCKRKYVSVIGDRMGG